MSQLLQVVGPVVLTFLVLMHLNVAAGKAAPCVQTILCVRGFFFDPVKCRCVDPCKGVICKRGEICQPVPVECFVAPCSPPAIGECVPAPCVETELCIIGFVFDPVKCQCVACEDIGCPP